ncbi:GGDEF domain-containing protein [Achromobacter aloeverae]|uniref:diguanylate cyclase n=1 Tax=Achromobacter aloeverae TaxID=1750518 RepID=A0A4Q1HPA4_9BURK|nr:GGDEF domain-containing protein [Achromobacter aloeverae]RXN92501.1 GGDEF domain-containing protein [Achromobacter aloeverae]
MLVSMLVCLLMLGGLGALVASGVPGVRACIGATSLTVVSVVIIASQPILPPIIGIVVGNTMLGVAMTLYLVAIRQFFGLDVPTRGLILVVVMEAVGLALFWYVWRSFSTRTVIISVMHCTLTTAMAVTILRHRPLHRPAYAYVFALGMASLQAVAHALRTVVYLLRLDAIEAMHQTSIFQVAFLSVGVFTLPGLTLGMIIMVQDRMLAERENEVNMDNATGVLSRKAWWLLVEKTVLRARRGNQHFSLLVLDIDRLRHINETYGHLLGNAVLRHFTGVAAGVLRDEDIIGRIDGEKFGILYPDARIDMALVLSDRLLRAVRDNASTSGNWTIGYTFSGGLVDWDGQEDARRMTDRAMHALRRAKEDGRDRIVAWPVAQVG